MKFKELKLLSEKEPENIADKILDSTYSSYELHHYAYNWSDYPEKAFNVLKAYENKIDDLLRG